MTTRRAFVSGAMAAATGCVAPSGLWAGTQETPLAMPPLLDATATGRFSLTAAAGTTAFTGAAASRTHGFNQPYLGPTLRLSNEGPVAAEVRNGLGEAISAHWHGLIVPGELDGGPHQPIAPGAVWAPELPINQKPATLWYHSHIHGSTARQVHDGLAGVLQLTDGRDDARGLPSDYGVDDLTLVLQDRRFDAAGRMVYAPSMHDQMMGFEGNVFVVNGQIGAVARVPRGVVRLRLVNGSNARVYMLAMEDGRMLHLAATDCGLLDRMVALDYVTLAPGERAEVLVDFSDGLDGALITGPNPNSGGAGSAPFLRFAVDAAQRARITTVPGDIGGSRPDLSAEGAVRRAFSLDMGMGMGMMMRPPGSRFAINGQPYEMSRIDFAARRGEVEHWTITGAMMLHPFHVHGVAFQVLRENGGAPRPQNTGWKDTVLLNGQIELLMRFDQPAGATAPYMCHCHILEHEDGGMMGQFTVG